MNCIRLLEWNHKEHIHIQFKADPITEISKFINAYKNASSHKKDFVWLKEVDSLALANAQVNLNKVYSNFFREPSL